MRELLEYFGVLESTASRSRARQSRTPIPLQHPHTPRRIARPAVPSLTRYSTAKDRTVKRAAKGWRKVMTANGLVEARGKEARVLEREYKQFVRRQAA